VHAFTINAVSYLGFENITFTEPGMSAWQYMPDLNLVDNAMWDRGT